MPCRTFSSMPLSSFIRRLPRPHTLLSQPTFRSPRSPHNPLLPTLTTPPRRSLVRRLTFRDITRDARCLTPPQRLRHTSSHAISERPLSKFQRSHTLLSRSPLQHLAHSSHDPQHLGHTSSHAPQLDTPPLITTPNIAARAQRDSSATHTSSCAVRTAICMACGLHTSVPGIA